MTKSSFLTQVEIGRSLYGPQSEGRIKNTSHVKDTPDLSAAFDGRSAFQRQAQLAREIYGPKPDGTIHNTHFVRD